MAEQIGRIRHRDLKVVGDFQCEPILNRDSLILDVRHDGLGSGFIYGATTAPASRRVLRPFIDRKVSKARLINDIYETACA